MRDVTHAIQQCYSACMRVCGVVQKGVTRGSKLGYPTANIPLADDTVSGIYAARVYIKNAAPYMAATFADPKRGLLEVHLLNFEDDLYGLEIEVELCSKLRDNTDFADDAALRAAIAVDIANV